ncbi:TolC family protein [Microbulbifer epialgicus]|uniref:TolC family protein n=1 Tax=Microbulbifer epialgicus TaxID=393907 RepID=A0ABV4P380_9GAMM
MFNCLRLVITKKPTIDRFFVAGAVLFLVALSGSLKAEQGEELSGLTYEQAILKSLQNHPELAGYRYQFEAVDALSKHAKLGPRPELSVAAEGLGEDKSSDGNGSSQLTVGISWLLQGDLAEKRVLATRSKTSVIEAQKQVLELEVAAKTARYFFQVLAQQERLEIAKRAVDLARTMTAEINRQVSVGKTNEADAFRAEVDLQRRLLAVEDVEHELDIARHKLAAQWGSREPSFLGVAGSLSNAIPEVDFSRLRSLVASNPNLEIFMSRERVAQTEIDLARAEAGIQWRIDTGIRRNEASGDFGLVAGFAIPIGKGDRNRNRNKVSALMAEQNRFRAERNAKEIALDTQLFVMTQKLQHHRHVADALNEKMIPSLDKALTATQKAYRRGRYNYLELALAQQGLTDAQLSLLQAQYNAHLSLIEIEKLTGLSVAQISESEI